MICACAGVTKKEFEEFKKKYPNMSPQFIKNALNIGKGCGSCNIKKEEITNEI